MAWSVRLVMAWMVGVVALAAPAPGEWSVRAWDWAAHVDLDAPPPPVASALEVREWALELGLDREQEGSLRAMAEAASARFDEAWLEAAEERGRLEETHPDRVHRRAWEIRQRLHRRYGELRSLLVSDLELIITPSQRSGWEAFEAGRERREALGRISMRGVGSLDLRGLVRSMELDEGARAAVAPILEEHDETMAPLAATVGRELGTLDRDVSSFFAERARARDEGADRRALRALFEEEVGDAAASAAEACARYHEAKASFARRVARELPEAHRDALLATVRDAIIERRSRGSEEALRFATALGRVARSMELYAVGNPGLDRMGTYGRIARLVEPLTDDQRERIEAIRDEFEAEFRSLRRRHGFIEPTAADLGGLTIAGGMASVRVTRSVERDEDERRRLERLFEELAPVEERVTREVYEVLTPRQRILFRMVAEVE